MKLQRTILSLALSIGALVLILGTFPAQAAVITSGPYSVNISPVGGLEPGGPGLVFRRLADGYDPILPGTPREAWGVSAGGFAGFADPSGAGVSGLVINSAAFGVSTANTSTFLNNGSNLLQIDQAFSFAASNVLKVETTITNVSGASQAVLYTRHVDWDIVPTEFAEIINTDPFSSPVVAASFFGFENPSPLVPFSFNAPIGGGGPFGPADNGGAFRLNLGTLAAGASTSFNVFHALSLFGQSHTGLESQLVGLGANFVITGHNSGAEEVNSAALAFGPSAAAVPEPTTFSMFGLAALGLGCARLGRRRRKAA